MKDKDLKYNNVLDKLKKTEPVLDDAGELTNRIIQRVEQRAAGSGQVRVMRISGIVSGVAASALICLLAYETLKYPLSPVENFSATKPLSPVERVYSCQGAELNHMSKTELIENRIQWKKAQRGQREQLSAAYIVRKTTTKRY